MINESRATILIVEDDQTITRFVRRALETQGYRILATSSGLEGLAMAGSQVPDLMILDLGLPDIDGQEVLLKLRGWSTVPVVVLSARDQERDKIRALDAGADDYLTKPFGVGELLARIRVSLRHAARLATKREPTSVHECGDLKVDLVKRLVRKAGRAVQLTPIEFRLLAALVRNAGRVMTHNAILREVWGPASSEQTHYVRIFIASLRRKIEDDPAHPRYLSTEPGVGYRFRGEDDLEE